MCYGVVGSCSSRQSRFAAAVCSMQLACGCVHVVRTAALLTFSGSSSTFSGSSSTAAKEAERVCQLRAGLYATRVQHQLACEVFDMLMSARLHVQQ